MPLIFEGHTLEEMVAAIHENEELKEEIEALNEELKEEIEELNEELSFMDNFIKVQHTRILMKNEKIEQLEKDLFLLEEAHDKLLIKYDKLVSSILDLVCDCDKM